MENKSLTPAKKTKSPRRAPKRAQKSKSELALTPVSLPTASDAVGQGDPAFAVARRHQSAARAGASVFLGATVALGAELARLRAAVKPAHGKQERFTSPKCHNVALGAAPPWRDIVKAQTGVGHETCRRAEKLADDILSRIRGKRDTDSKRARQILLSPDRATTYDDYAVLARVAGALYDADTWSGILVEAGIVRPTIAQIAANSGRGEHVEAAKQGDLPLFDLAVAAARGFLGGLRDAVAHREQWLQRLAVLPLDPTGDDDTPSLAELRAEINDRLTEIDSVILRKQSAN